MANPSRRAILAAAVIGVTMAALAATWLWPRDAAQRSDLQAVSLFSPARALPDFDLAQSDGTRLKPGELKGHWTLVFIGFTHCPDVCPTTLTQLQQAQKQWEALPETTRPRVLFVSVDPERDAPDRIGEYAHAFHRDTLAATGTLPALEAFTRSLSLVFMKADVDANDPLRYSVDHSATIAVLDPEARMAGVIQPPLKPEAIAADMIKLTKALR